MRAGMTITGMLKMDPTLFNGLQLPAGTDRATLVDTIVFNYGDLMLTNTDITWTKNAITVWGKRHKYYLDELYKTLFYQYNPVENYDRYEESDDTGSGKANTSTESQTDSGLSAFNSPGMTPDSQVKDTGSSDVESSSKLHHTSHIHGNIGVSTAMSMIKEQREIINISWYDEVAKLFASEFLIMIY